MWRVQGFYVMLDFHSNRYGNSLASGNESLYDQASWIQSWVALVKSVLTNTPAASGKLLIDLINEPDGCAPSSWHLQILSLQLHGAREVNYLSVMALLNLPACMSAFSLVVFGP